MSLKEIISRDLHQEDRDAKISEIIRAYAKYSTFRIRVWLRIAQSAKSSGGGYFTL